MSRKAANTKQVWIDEEIHGLYQELAPKTHRNLRGAIEVALKRALPSLQNEAAALARGEQVVEPESA